MSMNSRVVPCRPWLCYDVLTGHGSELKIYFKHDRDLLSKDDEVVARMGDIHIEGHSNRTGKPVNFYGIGFEPEVDGDVAVGTAGKRKDGTDLIVTESIYVIRSIEELTEKQ